MEEKRKENGAPPPPSSGAGAVTATPPKQSDTAASEPPSSRRRGQKRKANNNNSGSASASLTASSKRQAREKPSAVPFPPIHNGPCTRARQPPSTAALGSVPLFSAVVKNEPESVVCAGGKAVKAADELNATKQDLEALEAKIEAEYEEIRSRDAKAHVVPIPSGWFSWTKVHPLEEKALPSFFNGKSENQTPEIYMEIRNWIMKKFHMNPSVQIELKDLSELSVGELESRQEVMEFLDYWGLINYHPFPETDSVMENANAKEFVEMDPLVEKLYCFETEQPREPVVPRGNVAAPAVPSGLFPESAIVEELVRPEGPAVEYHCNSCSADCSRKRYHCQKQADFDLCSECFNNGKFGSDMSPSDFILMEPAEGPGVSGGKWTDQETLLLLEALELYKENWNEIAEHVATKTKAQCILHFIQMPIEETFLDRDDEIDSRFKENSDPVSTNDDSLVPKNAPGTTDSKVDANEDQNLSSPMEISKPEDASELKAGQENNQNCALKALKEAFEVVGSLPMVGDQLSFAEAGNPVMTLAAFLVRLVDPDVATASACNSLKSILGNSSGMHLATRHSFLMEDPPDDKKTPVHSDRTVDEAVEPDAQKDENQNDAEQKEGKVNLALEGSDVMNDHNNGKAKDSVTDEKDQLASTSGRCTEKAVVSTEPDVVTNSGEAAPVPLNESDKPHLPEDQIIPKDESDGIASKDGPPPNSEMESGGKGSECVPPPCSEAPKNTDECSKAPKNADQCSEAPMDTDAVSASVPLENKEAEQPVASNSMIEDGANTGEEEAKDSKNEREEFSETKNDNNIDKIKRAAVTAISAASVKAKLLANQEEDQIRQLATLLIEKQLHKLETKLAFFSEMENLVMRVREHLDRSRQRLYHERAQIIAARLGLPASSSRPMQQSLPPNRAAMGLANSATKPPMSMTSPRPPVSRPMMISAPSTLNSFLPSAATGNAVQPSNPDKLSSVGTK